MHPRSVKLTATRSELATALLPLARCIPARQLHAKVALWVEDGVAVLRFADMEARFPARGSWPSLVTFRAGFLVAHAQALPEDDRVTISYSDGRFTIGRVSVNCEIEDPTSAWPDFVELDSDFTMLQLLEAWLTYPDSQLDHSGLRRAIDAMIEDLELYFDEGRDALLAAHEALDEVYPGGLGINGRALIEILGTVRSQGFRD